MPYNAFFPCLQEFRMCRSKREQQKTDVCSEKKEDTTVREKNSLLFLNLVLKININLKNKLF